MVSFDEAELNRFAKNELAYIRRYVRDLPFSLLIAFHKEFAGLSEPQVKEKQQELYRMYRLSTDEGLLNLELALHGEAELIVKPEAYKITQDGRIALITKGGTWLIGDAELFGEDTDEVMNHISDWLFVRVMKGNPRIPKSNAKIVDAVPLQGHVNAKEAKRILDEYSLTPAEIILAGLGIQPNFWTMRLFFPRILPLFFYDGRPVHVIQLTNMETGKSEFAVRLEFVLKWMHFTEFPSAARLIYDGRQGTRGAVFMANGIVIDEIDKVSKQKFEECYQPMNTGLENGIWRRGVQTRDGVALEGYRSIPFILFGNIAKGETPLLAEFTGNPREQITAMLEAKTGLNVESFVERFAVCDIYPAKVPITEYLIRAENGAVGVLPDSIMRGVIRVIERNIPGEYVEPSKDCRGRLRRHAEAVYNLYRALFLETPDIDIVREVVVGARDLGALVAGLTKEDFEKARKPVKEIEMPKEIDIDMME